MSTYKYGMNAYRMYKDRIGTLQIRLHIRSVEIPDVEITSVDCIYTSKNLYLFACEF